MESECLSCWQGCGRASKDCLACLLSMHFSALTRSWPSLSDISGSRNRGARCLMTPLGVSCIASRQSWQSLCIRRGSRPGSGLERPTTEQCMTRKTTAVPIQFELCPAALCQPRSNCPSSVRPLCRIVRSGILALSAVPVQSTFGLWSSLCFCLAQFTNIICLLCYLRSSSG